MTRLLNHSDINLIRSAPHAKCFVRNPTQTASPADAWSTPNRADCARVKRCGRPSCHCVDGPGHGPKRYLSTIARTGERPRLGYIPNATYPQVAEFLANYRQLQEMLNEICAINAELLRCRESLD